MLSTGGVTTRDRSRTRDPWLGVVGLAVLILAILVPGTAGANTGSDLMPLVRNPIPIGCTWNNGCGGGYHGAGAKAVDFVVPNGTPVYASGAGHATVYGGCANSPDHDCNGGAGNYVSINHGSHVSRYLHLSGFAIGSGPVSAGQHIGYVGNSGYSEGAHLHYDEMVGGVKTDPGPLRVCHGGSPHVMGIGGWNLVGVGAQMRNDGYGCHGAATSVAEGSFVGVHGRPEVFRIAGGAPVYVSTWNAVGGPHPVRNLSQGEFDALSRHPRDGTYIVAGGRVYVTAGGSPQYVGSWERVGGSRPTIAVDPAAVDNAGAAGVWQHLRRYPADGTTIVGHGHHPVYTVVGGAPVYVSSWAAIGGQRPVTAIDQAAIDGAGTGAWQHLRRRPADGTYLNAAGAVYVTAGGSPVYVGSWARVGGERPSTTIDPAAIERAGQAGVWSHLLPSPPDGTAIRGHGTAPVYVMAGGAPIHVSAWAAIGGERPVAVIDPQAVAGAGTGRWTNIRTHPVDGTVLRAGPVGAYFRTTAGIPVPVAGPGGSAAVVVDPAAIRNAGQPGLWRFLRAAPQPAIPHAPAPLPPVVVPPATLPEGPPGAGPSPGDATPSSPAAPSSPSGSVVGGTPARTLRPVTLATRIPRRVVRARTANLSAKVSAAGARPVGACRVQRRLGRGWRTIASAPANRNGICSPRVRLGRIGTERIRIQFVGRAGFGSRTGPAVTVRVVTR